MYTYIYMKVKYSKKVAEWFQVFSAVEMRYLFIWDIAQCRLLVTGVSGRRNGRGREIVPKRR